MDNGLFRRTTVFIAGILCMLVFTMWPIDCANFGGRIYSDMTLTRNNSPYIITQDIIVSENATLNIQPGVELYFNPGIALQIDGSLQAKGNATHMIVFSKMSTTTNNSANVGELNFTTFYNDGIRLVDGGSYDVGRLEIFVKGKWGTVCDSGFDNEDAQVACRQLGFMETKRYYRHGGGKEPTWLDQLDCNGLEKSLLKCKHRGIGVEYCYHYQDVGIQCEFLESLQENVFFWKGVKFKNSRISSTLRHVYISHAYKAISGEDYLPDVDHVTITLSVFGVMSNSLKSPLVLTGSTVKDSKYAGVQIKGKTKRINIANTVISNTTKGHGFAYYEIEEPIDFCSVQEQNVSFPITFSAFGKAGRNVDCFKVIQNLQGNPLVVNFHSTADSGQNLELFVHDGITANNTLLVHVKSETDVYKEILPISSSGHQLYIRFRYTAGNRDGEAKFTIMDENDSTVVTIANSTFVENNGNGAIITNVTGKIEITETNFFRNKQDGLTVEHHSGMLSTNTDTLYINNSANGLRVSHSSFYLCKVNGAFSNGNKNSGFNFYRASLNCHFSKSRFEGNSHNGMVFSQVGVKCNMTDTIFSENFYHGISIGSALGHVNFRNITAMSNKYSGANLYDGKVSSVFQESGFSRNEHNGVTILNQIGRYSFYNCIASSNFKDGISLSDGRDRYSPRNFEFFILENSTVSENRQYGIKLSPECRYWTNAAVNVTLFINENNITHNHKGGVFLSPQSCNVYHNERPRRLQATITRNNFEQNGEASFYAYCTGRLGFNAAFYYNTFFNNTKNVVTLTDDTSCGAQFESNPVHVTIDGNSFVENRVESVIYIDYHSFPQTRSAFVKNNTFERNAPEKNDLFPNTFRRSISQACIVLKEGDYTLRENVFENPGFAFEIATLRHNVRRIIVAEFNWWGTSNECEIFNRLFDFHRRVQLSPVDFFPYYVCFNKTMSVSFNFSRPSCFLKGSTIGGILDRNLTLSRAGSPYIVRDDIIVLANATFVIPANVTLQFPARSAMVVQGRLIANGTESEKVKFVRLQNEKRFRLAEGAGPWEGKLEFLVNETWWPFCMNNYRAFTTEGTIVCRQLDLEYYTVRHLSVDGNVQGFVHNVVCDSDNNDIMNCGKFAWIYSRSCSGYTVHITCHNYHWAGVHLAVTQHRSFSHHVEIKDAGFAYRSDISVPGASLKIDINQHDLSHIYIHNSSGIGIEVTYDNLYQNASLIPNSSVSNAASHGFVSMSPWLVLTDVNFTKIGGSGFSFTSSWGETNNLADELASPEIYRTFHVCSANRTFLPENRIFYFSMEQLKYEEQFKCEHVMETEPGYKIVLQTLRHGFASHPYYSRLNIYNGVNKSQEPTIQMNTFGWSDRHVFIFSKSRISFDLLKDVSRKVNFYFFVYTIKENTTMPFNVDGGSILMARNRIFSSHTGVHITGNGLKYLHISDTQIINSRESGIKINSIDAEVSVSSVHILGSVYNGILIQNNLKSLLLMYVDVINSGQRAIETRMNIEKVKIASTRLQSQQIGIYVRSMSSTTDFYIENCFINVSQYYGMYIRADVNGKMSILNSSLTHSNNRAIYIEGYYYGTTRLNLVVTGSTFSWNKNGAIHSHYDNYYSNPVTMIFESNNFLFNQGPVFDIYYNSFMTSWILHRNKFQQNRGSSVIMIQTRYTSTPYRPNVLVSANIFSNNTCMEKAAIYIASDVTKFIMENNVFEFNLGRCVFLPGSVAYVPISIAGNVFIENKVADHSLIDVRRLDENAEFTNNSFISNRANGIFSLQTVYNTDLTSKSNNVNFTHNNLRQNIPFVRSRSLNAQESCTISLCGVLFFKKTYLRFNRFNNSRYTKEFCVLVPAISQQDIIDVSSNWWGTEEPTKIRDKTYDFDDNNDHAIANDWPFLNENMSLGKLTERYDSKQHGKVLAGRLAKSMFLKESESPYRITSDFTILKNCTLVVEAGVTLMFSPGVSILVIGALQVHGTSSKPVHFTLDIPPGNNKHSKMIVQLTSGTFPWEGVAKVFNGSTWFPLTATDNLLLSNLSGVICRQLGYGPSLITKQIETNTLQNNSRYIEFRCYGNETSLDECFYLEHFFNSSSKTKLLFLACRSSAWGNVRFVAGSATNVTQQPSILNYVQFSYCGSRHGAPVPAIEAVMNVPTMNTITVQNCTSGGVNIAFPNTNVYINSSSFLNTGATGVTVLQTHRKVFVENSKFIGNTRGISFEEPSAGNLPRIYYGRVFLCSDEKIVFIQKTKLFYFDVPWLKATAASQLCEKILTSTTGRGFKLVVLHYSGSQNIQIYHSPSTANRIISANPEKFVHKELFVRGNEILLRWSGDVNSRISLLVESINITGMPCTYEVDFCGWQTFSNVSVLDRNITRTWQISGYRYPYYMADHSYFSTQAKFLHVNGDWNTNNWRAGIISPIIKSSESCFIRFFYSLHNDAMVSIHIIIGSYPDFQRKLIWKTREITHNRWKKVFVKLPHDVEEYRIALVGECSGYRSTVMIDDLELRTCHDKEHHILNSVFSGNRQHSIQYASVAVGSDARPMFIAERCRIINAPSSITNSARKSAVLLEIQDNHFHIANNFIFNNKRGGIEARLGRSNHKTDLKDSLIIGNTFVGNANGAISLVERSGTEVQRMFVHILKNAFENNLGPASTIKSHDIQVVVVQNFFFNNSGLHSLEYEFSNGGLKGQKCELNTFYLNRGLGNGQSITIMSNGPMEYHRNNFKNPSNLYELSTTKKPISDPVEATRNWWGAGTKDSVRSRIYGKKDHHAFALVNYQPFSKLPPRNILSIGCPPNWQKMGSTCFVFRPGGQPYDDAVQYCQYHGGRMVSIALPEDEELIEMAFVQSRSAERQPPPIWVMTEDDLENMEKSGPQCTVLAYENGHRVVPCTSIYPFVCTRAAVIRCPNGCFHNGDCVGATCFCYRGWTGRDCSQFHCNDVHECSGNGECIGPNVCKCIPGFLGRGCTYSDCGKFRRCFTCSLDPGCGWCDSTQQCMAGMSSGPHSRQCPDWFYYTCQTVGINACSNEIWRIDCAKKQCNLTEETSTLESCQKCHDLEKCFNHVDEGRCRSWNDTRCPHGLVEVDYSDSKRINNIVYRENVKVVDPNITTIYNCPIQVPGEDDSSSVLVVPTKLGVKVGDVLYGEQAGGLMHKVIDTRIKGNFTFILGAPAQIHKVFKYADYSQIINSINLVDETTLDAEPNMNDVRGLLDGSIKLNNSTLHVLSEETFFSKCLGYNYKLGDDVITTQYIVMNKTNAFNISLGDVFVSETGTGFIENVVGKSGSEDMSFLETVLERCTENFNMTNRWLKSRVENDDEVYCPGGDNSYGLMVDITGDHEDEQIQINDLIVGRKSYPVLAKVVDSRVSGDFVLIEVLPVQWISNGEAGGIISIDQLHKKHRRSKRSSDNGGIQKTWYLEETLVYSTPQNDEIWIQPTVSVDFSASMSLTVDTPEDAFISGHLTCSLNIEIVVTYVFKNSINSNTLSIMKPKSFLIFSNVEVIFKIDGAIGIGLNRVDTQMDNKYKISQKIRLNPKFSVEGLCSLSGCTVYNRDQDAKSTSYNKNSNVGSEVSMYAEITPNVELKIASIPKILKLGWKKLKNFFRSKQDRKDSKKSTDPLQLVLSVAWPIRYSLSVKPCSQDCRNSNAKSRLTAGWSYSNLKAKLVAQIFFVSFSPEAREFSFADPEPESWCVFCPEIICNCESKKPSPGITTESQPTTKPTTRKPTTTKPSTTKPSTTKSSTTKSSTTKSSTTKSSTTKSSTTKPSTTKSSTTKSSTTKSSTTKPTTTKPTTTKPTTTKPTTTKPTTTKPSTTKPTTTPQPPKCPRGSRAVFVNWRYKCKKFPPPKCGEFPNCVWGRKGPGCSVPDFEHTCSVFCNNNGVGRCTDCGTTCSCNRGWIGRCCGERDPRFNWGDPHLQTLDGIEYDYFGIGEYWACKSVVNDFGIQFRFFAYQRASLTGGVAIKAGKSVLTVMTFRSSRPGQYPMLRIDGNLVNISSHSGQSITINNGTVALNIEKTFSPQTDEAAVALLSLQFQSGVTITMDVRYSKVMKRQYLNVLYTPTQAFKDHTEGLCGLMDNDQSNDFVGPRGEQYTDAIQFANSWQITSVRNNSGLHGSWSWNSTNFHVDDIMDASYNDPNYTPLYTLNGLSNAIITKATRTCSTLGLSDTMLKSCIYDVAVTNDTSLADQEALKQDCPNQCSGKGRCMNSSCHCIAGWSGESCQIGNCTDCNENHGKCIKGFCHCNDGWEGHSCDQKATCYNVGNCTSAKNGICLRTDLCRCQDGYIGRDCSISPTCSNVSDCSARGICVDYDVCKCQKEWAGKNCTLYSCAALDYCSGHGRCIGIHECECDSGWTGASCALADCAGANHCSGQGECIASDVCRCYPGFHGANCSDVADCEFLGNCSGNGVCSQENPGGNLTCRCYTGFSGVDCSIPSCSLISNCSGHGSCVEANLCECDLGYTGVDCSNVSCEGVNYCSGHGNCTGYDTCDCEPLWHGSACSLADCSKLLDCSNQGDCVLPDTCQCYPGRDGAACNLTAQPNLHAPAFQTTLYNGTVLENSPIGTKVIRVQASDADTGRNGQLLYSIDDRQNLNSVFMIDGISGEVITSSVFDYESSSPRLYELKVIVSDDGTPQKSSFAVLHIKVEDANDNCPIFNSSVIRWFNITQRSIPGTVLTVISATDADSGPNGQIRYNLLNSKYQNRTFQLDELNGNLTIVGELMVDEYRLMIVASDMGVKKCSREMEITVNVFEELEKKSTATTEKPTTSPFYGSTATTTTAEEDIAVALPTQRWYEQPMVIVGFSMTAFIIILFVVIVLLYSKKWKHKVQPLSQANDNYVCENDDCAENPTSLTSSTPNPTTTFVKKAWNEPSKTGHKEAYEMKSVPGVDV